MKVLCGQGAAPMSAEAMEYYYEHGIPAHGGGGGEGELAEFYYKAAPVPGFVCLCCTLLRLFGTVSFEAAVAPALALLDDGGPTYKTPSPWPGHHATLATTLRKLIAAERATAGPRVVKLQAARDCFYRGEVADELDAWWRSLGCFLRKEDLEAHVTRTIIAGIWVAFFQECQQWSCGQVTRLEDPVSIRYGDVTVHKCGTWTCGPMLLQSLRLVEGVSSTPSALTPNSPTAPTRSALRVTRCPPAVRLERLASPLHPTHPPRDRGHEAGLCRPRRVLRRPSLLRRPAAGAPQR